VIFWIEVGAVVGITAAFVLSSFFMFKPEHVEHHPMRVRIGALIQGLTIGALVGFVILPLRIAFFDPNLAPQTPNSVSSLSFLPAFILLIVIRRGALLRVPYIRKYLRAYRRASLLRTIDVAKKHLTRLDEIEGRAIA
jgi:hypothetical protein